MACHAENLDTLRDLIGAPLLGEVPRITPFSPGLASHHIDLNGFFSL
jgi:hypothetical protein